MAKPSDNGHYVYYSNGDSNKTCILVKLTDSALNAIENHLSSNSLALPSITFKSDTSHNNGVLSFPVPKSNHSHPDIINENSGGGPSERRFSFNLSNAEAGGPQGSFECLRQTDSRVLKGLGSIQYKMQIHASEDSYERTKERMAESQNESKKYCTKVIKGIGSTVGRRSKVKKITGFSQSIVNGSRDNGTRDSGGGGGTISNNSSHLHHSSALSSHNHHKSSSPTVIKSNSSGVNKYNLYHGSSNSTTISSSSLSSSSGTGLTSTTTSTSSSSLSTNSSSISSSNSLANNISSSSSSNTSSSLTNSQPSSINGSNLSMNRDAIKGNNSNSSTPNCNINASNSRNANSGSKVTLACNPELMKKSLRERVIHLLALRPYKKPELLARLNKEGIKEKDKKNLSQVFNTISKLKENAYNLAAHAWHEVQVDDWPFYTPEQREIVRKRKTLEIQQRSSTGKYGLSPLTCLQDSSPSASSVATSSSSTNNTNTNNSNSINNNNNNNNNSSLSSSTSKRSAETGSSNKRQRLNANNQSSSKRGLSPNVALNHNTNSMMNNSTNNNSNNFNNSGKNDLPDIMSEWSMKPRSPEPNYYTNSASNHNVDNSVNNGENNSGSMSKSWINENGSDENRSSHNASDYYSGRSTVNNLSDFDQYDNSHGNGHSSHDAHRTTNGYSNSSEGGNQTVNGHHYNNNNNRYSSNNNNNNNSNNNYHHHGNSMSTSKSDYNGDLHNSSGSGNSNSGNGLNSRKRLKNGYNNNNNNNNNNSVNNNSHSNHNSNMNNNNNNNNHSHHSSGMVNLLNSGSVVNGSNCSTPNSSPDSGTGSNDGNLSTISSKSLSSINCELPDYAIKFVEITSDDQSRKYKEEFNSEYKEYRRLHRNIDQVARKFSAFEAKLKSLPEGSDEWNKTLEEVFKEYDTIKKDYKFMESKRRVAYLHEKLSHIKKLIQEYKSSQGHRSTHYNTTTMSHHHTNYNNHHNNHNYHHHHKQQSNHHS